MLIPIVNFYTVVWISVPDEEKPPQQSPQKGTRSRATKPRRRSALRALGARLAAALDALAGPPQQQPAPIRISVTR